MRFNKYIHLRYMAKKNYGILIFILLATLVFSMIYPFGFGYGIQEGLGSSLTAVDISNVKQTLSTYTDSVESSNGACAVALTTIKSAKPTTGQTDFMVTNTIPMTLQQNTGSTNCTLVDKIAALNSTNTDVVNAISTCYGQKYTAVLNMLNNIQNSSAMKADSSFATIVNTQANNPSVNGPSTTYNTISQYINTAAS